MNRNANEALSLNEDIKENDIINCKVLKYDEEYNLIVKICQNADGIIKREEISLEINEFGIVPENIVKNYLNKNIKVRVKEVTEDLKYRYVLSRRDVEIQMKKWAQENLKEKMTINGKIINIQKYGVFVEIQNGLIGLLHIEDISIARTRHPSERFTIGQKIKTIIKSYDSNTGRIVLSHKELLGTWEENASSFIEGTMVYGIAREKEKNGIFVELAPNLVGLAEHKNGIEYGQNVTVYIKKIVPEKKKIKLVIV